MNRLEKIKVVMDLSEADSYIKVARQSADAVESFMNNEDLSEDERFIKIWDYLVGMGVFNEEELLLV